MEKEIKVLIFIFIFALIIRIIFVFVTPLKYWDETVYANLGHDLSVNLFDYSFANHGWSDYIPYINSVYSWPKAGFRAPLLPCFLSIFYLFKIDFLISFLMPLIGALSVVLVYILGEELFNKRVGLYASALFCFVPLHVIFSAKIMTDVFFTFFILVTIICFWKGYEKNISRFKLFFGLFLGLSILARYTGLWFIPIFLIYLFIRNKSLKFLKDRYFWYSFFIFILVLLPLFIYGQVNYGNPIGAFIHGEKAALYWGGLQPWDFFFHYWNQMFSFIAILFVVSLGYICFKKEFFKKEVYFVLIWIIIFFVMAIAMPHKEDRLIIPIVPGICLIGGIFLNKIKKYGAIILILVLIFATFSLYSQFTKTYGDSYTAENICFLKDNQFIKNLKGNQLVITDQSPIIYYYSKKETSFYPNPWSSDSLKNLIDNSYKGREVYALFSSTDNYSDQQAGAIMPDLEKFSEEVFKCSDRSGVYKINL